MATPEAQALLEKIDNWIKTIPGLEDGLIGFTQHAATLMGTAARTVLAGGVGIAGGALQAVLVVFLFLMITTMCVMHAKVIHKFTLRLTGMHLHMLNRFILTIRRAIFGVLVGVVLVALIQGALCGIAFAVAGLPQPAFWGLISCFVAPIPFVGTAIVWLPAVLILWFAGTKMAAIGLALWCAVFVTGVDSFMRPVFLLASINASILTLIIGIICGLVAFGPIGIFLGPILVAIAIQAERESSAAACLSDKEITQSQSNNEIMK
jgi:predicted PurR-regulated permease PerM